MPISQLRRQAAALIVATASIFPACCIAQVDFMEGLGAGDPEVYGSSANLGARMSNSECSSHVVSSDGRFVVFESTSSNLVAGDTNGARDVFLRDRQTGVTERISISTAGVQGNDRSDCPTISADGRFVAFVSSATNFDEVDEGHSRDVFVRDRESGTTIRISVSMAGGEPDSDSQSPSLSDDGKQIAFGSRAKNLIDAQWEGNGIGIYVRDLDAGSTTLISKPQTAGDEPPDAWFSSMSGSGRYLAFVASAPVLTVDDGEQLGYGNLFRVNLETGLTEWLDTDEFGGDCAYESFRPSISSDGSRVLFQSLVGSGTAATPRELVEVCLADMTSRETRIISEGHAGFSAQYTSGSALSADGSRAVFSSIDQDSVTGAYVWTDGEALQDLAVPGISGVTEAVFSDEVLGLSGDGETLTFDYAPDATPGDGQFDAVAQVGAMSLVDHVGETISTADAGASFAGSANSPVWLAGAAGTLSRDGQQLIISSFADNLVAGDNDESQDQFVIDRSDGTTQAIGWSASGRPDSQSLTSLSARISANGRYLVFDSGTPDLVESDSNNAYDVFLRDRESGITQLVSLQSDGQPATGDSNNPFVSEDGRWVAFQSKANLIEGGSLDRDAIYLRDMNSNSVIRVDTLDTERTQFNDNQIFGLSADGRYLLFADIASSPRRHLLFDREQLSVSRAFPPGRVSAPESTLKDIQMSSDARFIAFISEAAEVADDENGADDAYLLDRENNELIWVSRDVGLSSNPLLLDIALSAGGRYIALQTRTLEVQEGETYEGRPIIRFDRETGQLQRLDLDRFGKESDAFKNLLAISPDGEWVAFEAWDNGNPHRFGPTEHWHLDAGTHGTGAYLVHAAGNGFSGAFYDPTHSGHGWLLEEVMQGDQRVLAASWYAYRDGEQLWMIGTAPIEGDRASVPMTLVRGGDFPPEHDPANLQTESFGTLEIVLDDNNSGHASWTSTVDGLGSGETDFVRLTHVSDSSDASTPSGCTSGSWYNPAQSGHGLQIEVVDDGSGGERMLGIWYHYLNGEPRWILGSGPVQGDHAELQMAITDGPNFPPAYDPADLNQQPWGTLRFTVSDANHAHIDWDAEFASYTDGSMDLQRLTQLEGHACIN